MNDPSQSANYIHLAETNISLLLEGDAPLLIDEWQLVPQLWDAARFTIDQRRKTGQFILTGSAVPVDRSKNHPHRHRQIRLAHNASHVVVGI